MNIFIVLSILAIFGTYSQKVTYDWEDSQIFKPNWPYQTDKEYLAFNVGPKELKTLKITAKGSYFIEYKAESANLPYVVYLIASPLFYKKKFFIENPDGRNEAGCFGPVRDFDSNYCNCEVVGNVLDPREECDMRIQQYIFNITKDLSSHTFKQIFNKIEYKDVDIDLGNVFLQYTEFMTMLDWKTTEKTNQRSADSINYHLAIYNPHPSQNLTIGKINLQENRDQPPEFFSGIYIFFKTTPTGWIFLIFLAVAIFLIAGTILFFIFRHHCFEKKGENDKTVWFEYKEDKKLFFKKQWYLYIREIRKNHIPLSLLMSWFFLCTGNCMFRWIKCCKKNYVRSKRFRAKDDVNWLKKFCFLQAYFLIYFISYLTIELMIVNITPPSSCAISEVSEAYSANLNQVDIVFKNQTEGDISGVFEANSAFLYDKEKIEKPFFLWRIEESTYEKGINSKYTVLECKFIDDPTDTRPLCQNSNETIGYWIPKSEITCDVFNNIRNTIYIKIFSSVISFLLFKPFLLILKQLIYKPLWCFQLFKDTKKNIVCAICACACFCLFCGGLSGCYCLLITLAILVVGGYFLGIVIFLALIILNIMKSGWFYAIVLIIDFFINMLVQFLVLEFLTTFLKYLFLCHWSKDLGIVEIDIKKMEDDVEEEEIEQSDIEDKKNFEELGKNLFKDPTNPDEKVNDDAAQNPNPDPNAYQDPNIQQQNVQVNNTNMYNPNVVNPVVNNNNMYNPQQNQNAYNNPFAATQQFLNQ